MCMYKDSIFSQGVLTINVSFSQQIYGMLQFRQQRNISAMHTEKLAKLDLN